MKTIFSIASKSSHLDIYIISCWYNREPIETELCDICNYMYLNLPHHIQDMYMYSDTSPNLTQLLSHKED